jgi:hypothetical protein
MRCRGVARGIPGSTANQSLISISTIETKETYQGSVRRADGVVVLA